MVKKIIKTVRKCENILFLGLNYTEGQ